MKGELGNLIGNLKKGIVSQDVHVLELTDETMPQRLQLMFYALMLVMAWRTSDILYLTLPKDYIGYALLAFTLMAVEGGSLVWHHVHGASARGKEQQSASLAGFLMDFTFSIVTTVADITHVSGVQSFNLDQLQPFALVTSGLIVIANVGIYFYYDWHSPVKEAQREAARKDFDFKQRQADAQRNIDETAKDLDQRAHLLAKREVLAEDALKVAEREEKLRKLLDKADGLAAQTAKRGNVVSPIQATTAPSASKNGGGGTDPNA